MGTAKLSEDVRAIYKAYALEDQQYIEVVELHRYQQILQRWPLLAELNSNMLNDSSSVEIGFATGTSG